MDLITIPSMGRAKRQQTLATFERTGILDSYKVLVCVPANEAEAYARASYKGRRIKGRHMIWAVPDAYSGIARTRMYILMGIAKRLKARTVFMIDDDLSICHRPKIDKPDMPYINDNPYHMHRMVEMLTGWLDDFVHVGLIARQANRKTGIPWQEPGRLMNAYAYDAKRIRQLYNHGIIKFDRVPVMEDFDLTLQLLKMGYPNRISCRYAWTQTSNSDGGCSTYRTAEVQAAAARKMVKLHVPFVTIVESKKAKTWRNDLTERVDVRVAWKKALAFGQQFDRKAA